MNARARILKRIGDALGRDKPAPAEIEQMENYFRRHARGPGPAITGDLRTRLRARALMLLSGPATPATTSLLPETHIAVLPLDRLVATMEDAWGLLRAEGGTMPRAVNFVSGPSRTADIEQTVTLGAHGPYRVHIVIVGQTA